jgi:hypothetical protein
MQKGHKVNYNQLAREFNQQVVADLQQHQAQPQLCNQLGFKSSKQLKQFENKLVKQGLPS